MKCRALSLFAIAATFASCGGGGGHEKKITIHSSGNFTVEGTTITIEPGYTHNEKDLVLKGEKINLAVKSSDGKTANFDLTEDGTYLLNLQSDTLIGNLVNYGSGSKVSSITKEQLDHIIDSTIQLMEGRNASDANKTFFLPPFTIKKLSAQQNAVVISSFKPIPRSVDVDDKGNSPEVYKFFTNKQKRETLKDLQTERQKIEGLHK